MKKLLILLVTFAMVCGLAGCNKKNTNGPYFIAIVTGTASQGEDSLRAAEDFMKTYGKFEEGGIVKHATYPDNFTQEIETVINTITSFAADPACRAIIVCQGVPGTAAAFEKIKKERPDIILLIGSAHDDWNVACDVADVVVEPDNLARGYLMILAAKKLGAKNFVHISFSRHMGYEQLARRAAIMEVACEDLGMGFFKETAPDPTIEGMPAAQQYILEHMDGWVEQYGKDTAFFCTNDGHTEPMLKKVAELGAIFVEADLPSPILGYPGAFGIDLKEEAGDWPAILKKVEAAVVAAGGGGRMGTWAYSIDYTSVAALALFAKRCIEKEAFVKSFDDLMAAFGVYTPGAKWNGSKFTDPATNKKVDNYYLIYQDTYIMGSGYMNMIDEVVPEKYFDIK